MLMPIFPVSQKDFANNVLKAKLPVVVKFTSANCPPCRILTPYLKKLATQYNFQIKVYEMSIDVEENETVYQSFVSTPGVPTLVFFNEGEQVNFYQGFGPGSYLELSELFATFVAETRGEQYIPKKNLAERESEYHAAISAAEAAFAVEYDEAIKVPMSTLQPYLDDLNNKKKPLESQLALGEITKEQFDVLLNNLYEEFAADKDFQIARKSVLDASAAVEKKLISAVHTAGHEFSLNGTSIKKSGLPQKFIDAVLELGHHTVESIYGSMVGAPDVLRPYLNSFGLEYDEVAAKLKAMIPQETLDEWAKLKDVRYSTGALLPDDKTNRGNSSRRRNRGGVIRRDDDKK